MHIDLYAGRIRHLDGTTIVHRFLLDYRERERERERYEEGGEKSSGVTCDDLRVVRERERYMCRENCESNAM